MSTRQPKSYIKVTSRTPRGGMESTLIPVDGATYAELKRMESDEIERREAMVHTQIETTGEAR